ncbi:MAG: Uma2 family endonuclease [Thiothrix sp.]|nr:MAG: Uma2 family endonuclease [Thiothrix sp.]
MSAQSKSQLSEATYLAQESSASEKSEFLDGEVFAMAGASRAHNQITSNLVVAIGSQLLDKPCSVYASDMKVHTLSENLSKYSYPDLVATCADEHFEDEHATVLLNPLLIIEVLSDSTEAYDRGLKFFHYQLISSLREYILVAQDYCRVEQYYRQANHQWSYSEFHSLGDLIKLQTLQIELKVLDIYRRVL